VIVFAHRGASIELPENTLEAFRLALDLGADALETDARITRDGKVVLHHDPTAERTASVHDAVTGSSFEEVRRWNVAFGFRTRTGEGLDNATHRVPTLEEALEAFGGVLFNVDIKVHDAGAAAAVVDVVERCGAADRVVLTSFSSVVLRAVRARGYRGPTGLSRDEVLRAALLPSGAPRWLLPKGTRAQIPVELAGLPLDAPGLLRRLQAHGYAVDYWVVNDASLARRLKGLGADGVMTDDPRTIVNALR
jgi:glycerophosphoryl diester phosphodiesterase